MVRSQFSDNSSQWRLSFRLFRHLTLGLVCILITGCVAPITEKKLALDLSSEAFQPQNYRLAPGDVIRVDVFQEPDMLTEQRIAADGTINLALGGLVRVGGVTTEGAARLIEDKLRAGYLVNPQVTVTITAYMPRRFTILGQVNGPGSYEIPTEEVLTLPEALALAGGNSRIGNIRRVLISRKQDGSLYEIKVNMLTPEGRRFLVKEGDVITVPESLF